MAAPGSGGPDRLDWLDPVKALALAGVLLNHLVESFARGPWFTSPTGRWAPLAERLRDVYPTDYHFPLSLVQFLGWLGDSGPGVFIVLSGLGLTLGWMHGGAGPRPLARFYERRLLRIFPLYVGMHLVILSLAALVPWMRGPYQGPALLASLLGVRPTPQLFFYIAPAWWFVWLVLQLYLVFPLLMWVLERTGARTLLALALAATIASRTWGLLYIDAPYAWLTGAFFGTRLAEFAAGMVLARRLAPNGRSRPAPARKVLAWALPTWAAGLGASLTIPGSVVAPLLVSLGLTGLFYAAWAGLLKRWRPTRRLTTWVGRESYGIYLLHHTPLLWAAGAPVAPVVAKGAAIATLALSLPAARAVRWGVERAPVALRTAAATGAGRAGLAVAWFAVLACLWLVEPHVVDARKIQLLVALLLAAVLATVVTQPSHLAADTAWERWLRWSAGGGAAFRAFVGPPGSGDAAVLVGLLFGACGAVIGCRLHRRVPAAALSGLLAGLLACGAEATIRQVRPVEAGAWGELPALEIHPTRTYALRPNQVTRLRYNNYDYVLRTNSLGLAMPEIDVARPDAGTLRVLVLGDAFTMPEGLEYEQAYPSLLERRLAARLARRRVQVINAGVTGYGPAETLPQLKELAPLFRPDLVLYEFFVNEFSEVRLTRDRRLAQIGLVRTGSRIDSLLNRSQLLESLRRVRRSLAETLSDTPSAWRVGKALLEFYRTGPSELYDADTLALIVRDLRSMDEACRAVGARFLIVFVPAAIEVSRPEDISYFPRHVDLRDTARYNLVRPWKALSEVTASLHIPAVNLEPWLAAGPHQPVYFPDSWHWNAEGHARVAEYLDTLVAELLAPRDPVRDAKADTPQ